MGDKGRCQGDELLYLEYQLDKHTSSTYVGRHVRRVPLHNISGLLCHELFIDFF